MIGLVLFVLCSFEFIKIMQLGYYSFQKKMFTLSYGLVTK